MARQRIGYLRSKTTSQRISVKITREVYDLLAEMACDKDRSMMAELCRIIKAEFERRTGGRIQKGIHISKDSTGMIPNKTTYRVRGNKFKVGCILRKKHSGNTETLHDEDQTEEIIIESSAASLHGNKGILHRER